ncbi:MAG: hypothetical protein J6S78_02065 [Lachnospiraceae bacterium]|nr:hypothetical protein [Lachnospiraceae bacterium]
MDNFDLDSIKKFFPFTDKAVDVNGLLTCIIVYIIAAAIGGILIGFVPIIGWILGTLLELWFVIGVLLAIFTYLKANSGGSSNGGSQQ